MSFFDAFDAVRRLHAAAAGSAPAQCADLARGYAHLALLTDHLRAESGRAFKARALLYAHRAAARGAPTGAWAVAYASVASGLHAEALAQAKAAEGTERPEWAKVVRPVCEFDYTALLALAKDRAVGSIAGVLAFDAADNSVVDGLQIQIGTDVVKAHPDCFRVADRVATIAWLGIGRAFIETAPKRLSEALADHLARWPALPPGVGAFDRVRARDADADRALLRALDAADAPSEPALSALAALVRFERAANVGNYSHMADIVLGVPAMATAHTRQELPFLEGHPDYDIYARVLEVPNGPPRPPDGRGAPEVSIYGSTVLAAAELSRTDDTEDDLRRHVGRAKPEHAKGLIARLIRTAPNSPHARVGLVTHDWDTAAREAAEWEKRFANRADVLAALGRKYHETGRPDDAERALLAATKHSADNATYQRLATIYTEVRKDEAKALAVMKERLTRPDYGLECSRMRVRIAAIYARNKDLRTALSYAERAAEDSGAAWAMSPTIAYANQLGDREKVKLWSARMRERYGP